MITQVSNFKPDNSFRDPRRKSQSIRFKNSSVIPYKGMQSEFHTKAQRDAFCDSFAIVAGSAAFTIGYLILSGIKRAK